MEIRMDFIAAYAVFAVSAGHYFYNNSRLKQAQKKLDSNPNYAEAKRLLGIAYRLDCAASELEYVPITRLPPALPERFPNCGKAKKGIESVIGDIRNLDAQIEQDAAAHFPEYRVAQINGKNIFGRQCSKLEEICKILPDDNNVLVHNGKEIEEGAFIEEQRIIDETRMLVTAASRAYISLVPQSLVDEANKRGSKKLAAGIVSFASFAYGLYASIIAALGGN